MSVVKNAVICCAGIGSRLGLNLPKCLININDKKLIDYQLYLLQDVENIMVVVGFLEEEVIYYISKIRSDIIFVRNPDYLTTSTSHSLHLASKFLQEPFLLIDGDILINKESFKNFLAMCKSSQNSVICYTERKSEDPILVELSQDRKMISKFIDLNNLHNKLGNHDFEWSGIAYLNNIKIKNTNNYIYKQLKNYLPLTSCYLDCYEIDTPKDLDNALKKFKF